MEAKYIGNLAVFHKDEAKFGRDCMYREAIAVLGHAVSFSILTFLNDYATLSVLY
jgi:hypothetical protein